VIVVCRLKCVVDGDGKHSALFACIAEIFQHLDIEVILLASIVTECVTEKSLMFHAICSRHQERLQLAQET